MEKRINQKKENNNHYINGDSFIPHYCIEKNCNNRISYNNFLYGKKRCIKCYTKTLKGKNNPNYIDNRTNNKRCFICNKKISKYSKHCSKCNGQLNKGKNNSFYNKKHTEISKQKISDSQKGKKNHMFGKTPIPSKKIYYRK